MSTRRARPICFHLPQFHRVAQNDRWWGEGFTEWTLVDGARPLFQGHRQPVAPHADIGAYDLTHREVRARQARMARRYGIYGFCYYHYWFGGTRLLEQPLEHMLADGEPDLPFCLCWANEPWSRRWSGEDREVLQAQVYGDEEDWRAHFALLLRFFNDPRYIRVDDRPMFLVYRPGHIEHGEAMIHCWRELARSSGLAGLHIVAVEGSFDDNRAAPAFADAVVEHHPSCVLPGAQPLRNRGLSVAPVEELWKLSLAREDGELPRYRGACAAWDNTPRRGRDGYVVLPSRPERFARHLDALFRRAEQGSHEPYVFLNAWNEWSEGAHLEPDDVDGYDWLARVDDALHGRLQVPDARRSLAAQVAAPDDAAPIDAAPIDGVVGVGARGIDVDLVHAFVLHGDRHRALVAAGCGDGRTAERIGLFAGVDHAVGIETDAGLVDAAGRHLDEVLLADPAALPGLVDQAPFDLALCPDLPLRSADPVQALARLATWLGDDARAWIGFQHAGYHQRLRQVLGGAGAADEEAMPRAYSLDEARALVARAGYRVDQVYRVYGPRPAASTRPAAQGNRVDIGGVVLDGLSAAQVDALFCQRFFLVARPSAPPPRVAGGTRDRRQRLDRSIAPADALYREYARNDGAEEYFDGALRQVDYLDELVTRHRGEGLAALASVADYACHYGRLLRALRASFPTLSLTGYDIDAAAVAFCATRFRCHGRLAGWQGVEPSAASRHDLLAAISLLTHTDHDFFVRVLAKWQGLLAPGGLLVFSYLGAAWLKRWQRGELDHYGSVDPATRRARAAHFADAGHAFASIDSPYSTSGEYGVGFLHEDRVRVAVDALPALHYLGTVPGDDNPFGQDLAIVRAADDPPPR